MAALLKKDTPEVLDKVKSVLVTQPRPETEKSPYFDLEKKLKIKIDFREFINVQGIEASEFRKERINIADYTAVVLTGRYAIDHFFRMCTEMRVTVPDDLKYYCMSEAIAYYLQKYITFRKRKIFHGKQTFADLLEVMKKSPDEKFFIPCADIAKAEYTELLTKNNLTFAKGVLYKTVCSDLSDLAEVNYDVIAFFSPASVESLYQNFPKFKQNKTRIAAFGPTTAQALKDAKLTINISAPSVTAPSMTMALEQYITKANKGK
jgi:uroporphyrinogen-III synthase